MIHVDPVSWHHSVAPATSVLADDDPTATAPQLHLTGTPAALHVLSQLPHHSRTTSHPTFGAMTMPPPYSHVPTRSSASMSNGHDVPIGGVDDAGLTPKVLRTVALLSLPPSSPAAFDSDAAPVSFIDDAAANVFAAYVTRIQHLHAAIAASIANVRAALDASPVSSLVDIATTHLANAAMVDLPDDWGSV